MTCQLCDRDASLCESHVIPKFVFKWIKDTSATKRLRSMDDPDRLKQDGRKPRLLCADCERIFNRWETLFAKHIFWPYISRYVLRIPPLGEQQTIVNTLREVDTLLGHLSERVRLHSSLHRHLSAVAFHCDSEVTPMGSAP